LSGANTYTGTTTISVGTLNLTGSLMGAGGSVLLSGVNTALTGNGTINGSGRGVIVQNTNILIGAVGVGNGPTINTQGGTAITLNSSTSARVLGVTAADRQRAKRHGY
jgi:hypothetical protein